MSDPFIAEIRIFTGNFAPIGWALCNGQFLSISQNTALFSLLGTTFGGNGTSNFQLPNLQGAAPLHQGSGPGLSTWELGQTGGETAVTLLTSQMPSHTHALEATSSSGNETAPQGTVLAEGKKGKFAADLYATTAGEVQALGLGLGQAGGSQPHNNMPPYLTMNFIIALQGIYPARS